MIKTRITRIRKRDRSIVAFDSSKIEDAIYKALSAAKTGDRELAASLTRKVADILEERFARRIPGVEDIQDIVEEVLMSQGYPNVAKTYIIYRQRRADERRLKKVMGVRDDLKLGINALKVNDYC